MIDPRLLFKCVGNETVASLIRGMFSEFVTRQFWAFFVKYTLAVVGCMAAGAGIYWAIMRVSASLGGK